MLKTWTHFDDGREDRGIEGKYIDIAGYRFIYVDSTNSRADWLANFFGWRINVFNKPAVYNKVWKEEGEWLRDNILTVKNCVVIGYSSGYARAIYANNYVFILGIAGASPTIGGQVKSAKRSLVWKKGDIVPFAPFSIVRTDHRVVGKWQPFWKAHIWSGVALEEEVMKVVEYYTTKGDVK